MQIWLLLKQAWLVHPGWQSSKHPYGCYISAHRQPPLRARRASAIDDPIEFVARARRGVTRMGARPAASRAKLAAATVHSRFERVATSARVAAAAQQRAYCALARSHSSPPTCERNWPQFSLCTVSNFFSLIDMRAFTFVDPLERASSAFNPSEINATRAGA